MAVAMEEEFTNSIYKVSRKIKKREQQSLYNSLRSIYQDSEFVGEIRGLWPQLPLLANLRCGRWYFPSFHETCYFKSTDGHTGNWSFNPTRLNMHVAHLAGQLAKTLELFDCAINCGIESASLLSCFEPRCYLHLPVVDSKHDRFSLQNHLSRVVAFAKEKLRQQYSLLILCADGEDLSVCVCLTILLALFNGEGVFDDGSNFTEAGVTKWGVRQHLVYLCNFTPNARPSRGNLRQVFNFLSRNMMS